MATIRDVAEKAGVSIATVSNYLNGTKPVSPASAQKISQAVQELQYTANAAAKGLRAQKSHEIGVILPNFDDPYYVQIFQGIEKAFSGSSYFLSIAFSSRPGDTKSGSLPEPAGLRSDLSVLQTGCLEVLL